MSDRPKSVLFLLPVYARVPAGGYKIAFDYANRLAERGYRTGIAYQSAVGGLEGREKLVAALQAPLKSIHYRRLFRTDGGAGGWFALRPEVEVKAVTRGTQAAFNGWDAVVATSWRTAEMVERSGAGARLYLIQHFEDWDGDAGAVERSWQRDLHKVAIARWLMGVGARLGVEGDMSYVPNGMDLELFRVVKPIEDRDPWHVGMLVHKHRWKATEVGLEALQIAKDREPRLKATVFGAYDPVGLPSWASFKSGLHGEAVRDYYNDLAVFIHPSRVEGWPLPPAEAMACGCLLIAADNPGVLDYADSTSAVVVPREDAVALAEAIIEKVRDSQARIDLARAGNRAIQAYTWERAVNSFEQALQRAASTN